MYLDICRCSLSLFPYILHCFHYHRPRMGLAALPPLPPFSLPPLPHFLCLPLRALRLRRPWPHRLSTLRVEPHFPGCRPKRLLDSVQVCRRERLRGKKLGGAMMHAGCRPQRLRDDVGSCRPQRLRGRGLDVEWMNAGCRPQRLRGYAGCYLPRRALHQQLCHALASHCTQVPRCRSFFH